jgi:hypothetical protein
VIAVRDLVPDVLLDAIRKAPLTDEKVAFAWRFAVGHALARATAVQLRGRMLHVQARDAAWRREIERSCSVILSRLESILGGEVVTSMRVHESESHSPAPVVRRSEMEPD